MSEPTQAERLAALQAKRDTPPRAERDTTPSTQRVVVAGLSVVSFASITMAMGPLTAQAETVDAGPDNDVQEYNVVPDPTSAQVPETAPNVVVEVIPNYVPVSEDGTPLPAETLLTTVTPTTAPVVATTAAPATATPATATPATATPATATEVAPPPPPKSEASS